MEMTWADRMMHEGRLQGRAEEHRIAERVLVANSLHDLGLC